jgi:adenylosuccinate synthase
MKAIKANNCFVIGLGFGDEGKGITTDYLCSQTPNPLVIRFSGGQQAGHTVRIGSIKHVFSNFGSGTLRGFDTYWDKNCIVDPIGLFNEYHILKNKNINPVIYINKDCPITTPYDMADNRQKETINNHGSCGVGIGSTMQREDDFYHLKFIDLYYPTILTGKLRAIRNYYGFDVDLHRFMECVYFLIHNENIHITDNVPDNIYTQHIYEGSQGLLLDQHYGFFPNVTRANIGINNIKDVANKKRDELYLITRTYQTRHGNGFMTNEDMPNNIYLSPEETNKTNEFQGKFRIAILDVSLLEYAIKVSNITNYFDNVTLVITCLDHIENEYRFTYNNKITYCSDKYDFIDKIKTVLNIDKVLFSESDESENLKQF